jgi:hypothetical protein
MDLHAAMGGTGSAEHWATVNPPLARPDMTHFTNQGYNLLGRYIAGGIMKLYDSGPDAGDSSSLETKGRPGELLPPLYSGPAGPFSAASRGGFSPEPPSAQIYYFLRADGQVIVTNDLSTVDDRQGRLISAEEAGCFLRRKAAPCDNTVRW